MAHETPFSRDEAESMFFRVVAGWADRLDDTGARIYLDGVTASYDAGGSYEGVTRMFWALGGWLSHPDRPGSIEWRGKRYDLVDIMRRAVLAGTNPESRGYWGTPREDALALVESGHVGFSLWQTRTRIWNHLSRKDQEQIVAWLAAVSPAPESFSNNFAMFWLLNHGSRQALGETHDDALISSILDYFDGVHCGNGWYDDGPSTGSNHFDDYNYWVFASHFLCWAQTAPDSRSNDIQRHLERVRLMMEHVPYFYGSDGAYALFGRSLSYKFARLGAPLWAHRAGVWPHAPGMLRRLVGQHLRWHFDRGAIRGDGTLAQGLTSEGSVEIRETYGSAGAPYWAMQGFGGLWSLSDDDPFWTDDEVPLPVEQDDFLKSFPEPGWLVVGTKHSGQVQRFSAHSSKYPAKYGKFSYSTLAPFNAGVVDGRPSPDSMLSLVAAGEVGHRDRVLKSAVSEEGWLRFTYEEVLGGFSHQIETAIVIRGDTHLRIHRVQMAEGSPSVSAIEGAAPLGFPPGGVIESGHSTEPVESWARSGERLSCIRAISGYSRAGFPVAWRGQDGINSVYGKHVLPHLVVEKVVSGLVLVSLVTSTISRDTAGGQDVVPEFRWDDTGEIRIDWGDSGGWTIPPLS